MTLMTSPAPRELPRADLPRVAVLLAVHNGERWLGEQLDSIFAQQGATPVVLAGDDGSTDGSAALLAQRLGPPQEPPAPHAPDAPDTATPYHALVPMRHGSATRTFLSLVRTAMERWPDMAWFAFCDQDDIWLPDKLARAVGALQRSLKAAPQAPSDPRTPAAHDTTQRPALYGGRTIIVDAANRDIGLSRLHPRPPAFGNAIVQSIMGGNTMVFNRQAAQLMVQAGVPDVQSHDWWAYMLVSGCGGTVVYDPAPCLRYRQHGGNQVGSNLGPQAAAQRVRRLWRGDFRGWNQRNLAALQTMQTQLTPEARRVLAEWSLACTAPAALQRLRHLRASGVWRQAAREQWMLTLACAAGRL